MDVRVVVVYSDEQRSVQVDDMYMDDISAIREKRIEEWFCPSNDRDGWEGLIKEIKKLIADEDAKLYFEFKGAEEDKKIFYSCVELAGYKNEQMNEDMLAQHFWEKAQKLEHREEYESAFEKYEESLNYFEMIRKREKVEECQKKIGELCYKYYLGEFTIKNMSKKSALKKAAYIGIAPAQVKWGDCLRKNSSGSSQEVLEWYKKAAQKENVDAYLKIAEAYKLGYGEEKNVNKAQQWYEKAAQMENSEGEFFSAEYYFAAGVSYKAFELYLASAEQSYIKAYHKVGMCYEYGWGVEENLNEASKWYLKSAEVGELEDVIEVGYRYENGIGFDKDEKEAEKWYQIGAKNGDERAQLNLGKLYLSGRLGKVDYKSALYYFEQAAARNNTEAQYELAKLYENGQGVSKDEKEVEKWYRMGAKNGDERAQLNLGKLYLSGRLGKVDYKSALHYFAQAAARNNAEAQYELAKLYENGQGVSKDDEKAYEWYKKAADEGIPPSKDACYKIAERYYKSIDPDAFGRTCAFAELSLAVPITNVVTFPAALVGSGISHKVQKSKFMQTDAGKEMMRYYHKAADLGHEGAKKRLEKFKAYEK